MDRLVGVTDVRDSLKDLLDEVREQNIIVLRHNRPVAVILHPDRLERLLDRIEDLEDTVAVLEDRLDPDDTVPHEDVMKRAGLRGKRAGLRDELADA
jgi:prevent-host-death family protein